MIGFIKKIFAAVFGVLLLPLKLFSFGKKKKANTATEAAPKKNEAFFLEESEAKEVSAPAPKKAKTSKKAKAAKNEKAAAAPAVAATANALNLPQPTVTNNAIAENSYVQFTTRRRPGANMKSYLDMAKTIKNA
jgi:cbb3-type cytochrome oxidase subunit 3